MTDARLKELFEDALAGEPPVSVPPDEDIARGRARRAHIRRTRVSIGAATLAVAWLGAIVVPNVIGSDGDVTAGVDSGEPSDEVWPYDDVAVPDGAGFEDFGYPAVSLGAASGRQPVIDELFAAVVGTVPEGVTMSDVHVGPALDEGVVFRARRGANPFTINIDLQEARPDLDEFQPCTEPAQTPEDVAVWSPCEQGYDDDGRWRVVGQAGDHAGVAVVEGGSAAASVRWDSTINDIANATEIVGDFSNTLSFAEANAIAEAAWAVGSRYDEAELRSGYDIDAVEQDGLQVEASLESVLGPLQEVEVDRPDRQAITASYLTEAGESVDLAVWQADRRYQNICTRMEACEAWPGSTDYFARLSSNNQASSGGNTIAARGRVHLSIEGLTEDTGSDVFQETLGAIQGVLDQASD